MEVRKRRNIDKEREKSQAKDKREDLDKERRKYKREKNILEERLQTVDIKELR